MEFGLAAFNAHWGIGRFGHHRGVRFDVPSLVESWSCDVVVIPESWRHDDGTSILDPLRASGWHIEELEMMALELRHDLSGVRDGAPREGIWELALCSRFPVVSRREIVLGTIGADPVGERRCLACVLDVGGTQVEVVALHTSSWLLSLGPLRHLAGLRSRLEITGGPQIIAGDFNFWGPPIAMMMRGWKRPVRGRTYPGHRPHSQIDHVLVRGGVSALSGEVLPETPSDHRPVRVRLRV